MDGMPTTEPSLLELHFDNAADGQYVLDPAHDVFVKVNQAFCDLVGYTEDQLIHARRPLAASSVVHPDDRTIAAELTRNASDNGHSGTMRIRALRSDGDVRWLEIQFKHVKYMDRLLRVGSARDVSRQVKLETKLQTESEFNRLLTVNAQKSAEEARKRSFEVLEANTRVSAMGEVLSAIPVFAKRVLEIEDIDELYKETVLTMVEQAQFSSCQILTVTDDGGLEVKHANPFRRTGSVTPDNNDLYPRVMSGELELGVDDEGNHVAPIHRGTSEVRGLLHVGLPRNLQRFYADHRLVQKSIQDLVVTVAEFVGIAMDNMENLETVRRQSRVDALTGLLNRRVFDQQLVAEFRRAVRYERDLSLMILDIDHFGRINNTYGHQQGDLVLEMMGELLNESFRDLDTVCRYGGEEICVIMPETVGEVARNKAEHIRRKIEELAIPLQALPGRKMSLTVSIGVAGVSKATVGEDQLLRDADKALYFCKQHGRNQVKLAGA